MDVFAVFVLKIVASSAAFALKKYSVASNREAHLISHTHQTFLRTKSCSLLTFGVNMCG
ncbi:hypothetical protein HMPREF1584_00488 [Gardnerella vaginalis JCP8481A]|nr:hypothetical protein HMPREF1584_00488 [Gardnerella vaginalis JCP8481A]